MDANMKRWPTPTTSRSSKTAKRFHESLPQPSPVIPNLFNIDHPAGKVVFYENVHPSEDDYKVVEDLISDDSFIIENVVRIKNPYLEKAYQLKKEEKIKKYGSVSEHFLFHGTKKANLKSICTENFDWRLRGTNRGHRFGKGVSFTHSSQWASYYGDEDAEHKVMILAKVLVGKTCLGHNDMVLPGPGCDTSKNESGAVTVKYGDNEFLPKFKIYYQLAEDSEEEEEEDEYYEEEEDEYDYEEEDEESYEEEEDEEYYDEDDSDYDYYDEDDSDYDYYFDL